MSRAVRWPVAAAIALLQSCVQALGTLLAPRLAAAENADSAVHDTRHRRNVSSASSSAPPLDSAAHVDDTRPVRASKRSTVVAAAAVAPRPRRNSQHTPADSTPVVDAVADVAAVDVATDAAAAADPLAAGSTVARTLYAHALDSALLDGFWDDVATRLRARMTRDAVARTAVLRFVTDSTASAEASHQPSTTNVTRNVVRELFAAVKSSCSRATSCPELSFSQFFEMLRFLNVRRIAELEASLAVLDVHTGGAENTANATQQGEDDEAGEMPRKRPRKGSMALSTGHSRSGSESIAAGGRRLRHSTRSGTRSPSPWSLSRSPTSATPITDPHQLQIWKRSALFILEKILVHKDASMFMSPVTDGDYVSLIKRPMFLDKIKSRIRKGLIKSTNELHRDLMLIIANAVVYNGEDSDIAKRAINIRDFIQSEVVTLQENTH